MERVFGLPAQPLSIVLEVLLALAFGAIALLALRNVVFLKIGLRNIPRRRARSALIVLGLMLGTTIIASALLTGDTMSTTVRSSVVRSLGDTDETVTSGTDAHIAADMGVVAAKPYFDVQPALRAVDAEAQHLPVDGVLPAIVEPVAAQHAAAGKTAPRLTLFAPAADRAATFGFDGISGLHANEVLLDRAAAEELAAHQGSTIVVLAGDRFLTVRVAKVADLDGTGSVDGSVVLPLAVAQKLLGHADQVNHLLVSNDGDATTGAAASGVVETALDRALRPLRLDAQPVKKDGLDTADQVGNVFVQLFTTFGSFSMAAGMLLIFLIFVLLAGERRPEMGMARAVGTQRRHLVQTFLYEGAAYDLGAAVVGAVLGIGVSYVMVRAVASAFTEQNIDLRYAITFRSIVIAFAIGVLLTLAVVTLSAWRVSRLNIVSAIRDLPEPRAGATRRRLLLAGLGVLFGSLMAVSGVQGHVYLPWMLGVSLVVVSLMPLIRATGRSERAAYTVGGAFLLVFWMLPLSAFDSILGDMSMDFSVWIASGLIVVVAATWLVTYNADVLLGFVGRVTSPFASLRPIMRMAVAYPLRNRFRTGVTMAMFMLVVFTLVTGTTIPSAFVRAFDDVHSFGGGFDVQATTAPAVAVDDLRSKLPAAVARDVVADGAQSFVPVDAVQDGATRAAAQYPLRGLNATFLERTTYTFIARANGYSSDRAIWSALAAHENLAVVDAFVAPRRNQWGFAVMPEFHLSGFYVEDRSFDPVKITATDPLSGAVLHFTVIGVLSDNVPYEMSGITVSQAALAPFGSRALPTVHHLALRPGADPEKVADEVEASLLPLGVEANTYTKLLDDAVGANMLFIRLVQGFMGLGLVVGVAALGVISARAVVERRQQLGMLRAIGFQPTAIRRILLAEASMVTMTAIVVGCVTGLIVSYNVIADAGSQPGADVHFAVPWLNLAIVFGTVVVASLATTLVSALRASRIYPAEALRYQ
jgi:putative ABC transport system permease protein